MQKVFLSTLFFLAASSAQAASLTVCKNGGYDDQFLEILKNKREEITNVRIDGNEWEFITLKDTDGFSEIPGAISLQATNGSVVVKYVSIKDESGRDEWKKFYLLSGDFKRIDCVEKKI